MRRGGHGRDLFAAEQLPEEDINDVVDMDDRRVEMYVSQQLVGSVIESGYFKAFIFILIIINSILIALQTDEEVVSAESMKLYRNVVEVHVSLFFLRVLVFVL